MKMYPARTGHWGFTLIEVMIVVIIVAVLMMVALPAYQESMKKSRRAEGMRALMELASRQERFYAQNSRYTTDIATADGLNFLETTSENGHYDLTAGACDDGAIDTCYKLTATPRGVQARDTACGALSVDSRGVRKASGPADNQCW